MGEHNGLLISGMLAQRSGWGSSSKKNEQWNLSCSTKLRTPVYIHWLGCVFILAQPISPETWARELQPKEAAGEPRI